MANPIIERKFSPINNIELSTRSEGDSTLPKIMGYSAMFDSETIIQSWWGDPWKETIRAGFFAPAIKNKHDVRALFNHDANYVLGRTTSPKRTLVIKEDEVGLFSTIIPPNTTAGRDTVESIERGDISGQSFAFTIASEKWIRGNKAKGELDTRELLLIETLYDIGPVTYPAFEETDISVDRANGFAQVFTRARGLRQLGEELPSEVLREIQSRTQIQVPYNFERSLIVDIVKEVLAEQRTEQITPEPVDPPKKDEEVDLFATETVKEEEAPQALVVEAEEPKESPIEEPKVEEHSLKKEFLRLERVALGI